MQAILIMLPVFVLAFVTLVLLVYVFAVQLPQLRDRKGKPDARTAIRRR